MIILLKGLLHIHMKYKFKNQGRNLGGSCSESILTENAFQNSQTNIHFYAVSQSFYLCIPQLDV